MKTLIVGSIGIDSITTQTHGEHTNLLGGSASYAAIAASYLTEVRLVGVVGTDFPKEHVELFEKHNVDLQGLERVEGKTFRWAGEYETDMNKRKTLSLDLNVFENFSPKLPPSYQDSELVLLANIAPSLQLHVLDAMKKPTFTVADTMDLWIDIAKEDLIKLLKRIDMIVLNDGEARAFTGEDNLLKAGQKILAMGPQFVVIKEGEHGSRLMSKDRLFITPAFPLEECLDPTGAGDTFVGGLVGYCARSGKVDFDTLCKAIIHGTLLASFNVESFGPKGIVNLEKTKIEQRLEKFIEYTTLNLT